MLQKFIIYLLFFKIAHTTISIMPRDLIPAGRIVGGAKVSINQYPHQVSLQRDGGKHYCGGTIISKNFVLTAAHCVWQTAPVDVLIVAGSSTHSSGGSFHLAVDIKIHPNYDRDRHDYDVAAIQVEPKFKYDAKVQPILIATDRPVVNDSLVVTGWGAISEGGELSSVLKAVSVPFVTEHTCKENYFGEIITARMFCAGTSGRDSCQGDSGGPIIRGGVLLGAVSWGQGCAMAGYPGVYTNFVNPTIRQWIKQKTGV